MISDINFQLFDWIFWSFGKKHSSICEHFFIKISFCKAKFSKAFMQSIIEKMFLAMLISGGRREVVLVEYWLSINCLLKISDQILSSNIKGKFT